MNPLQAVLSWLGLRPAHTPSPELIVMREALENGRREKRAEHYAVALDYLAQAEQLAELTQDRNALAVIHLHRADVLMAQEKLDEAEQLLQGVLESSDELTQKAQRAYALSAMGTLAQQRGSWAQARQYYEQSLQLARATNALGAEGRALGHLADVYLNENNASYAIHLLREALPKLNASNDIELSSYFVGRLGEALSASGQEQEGKQLLQRALRLAEHMQYRPYECRWHLELGTRAVSENNYQEAYAHFQKGIALLSTDRPPTPTLANALRQFSLVNRSMGDYPAAAQYAELAIHAGEALGDTALVTSARGVLGMTLHAQGQSAAALPYLQAAVALYREQDPPTDRAMFLDLLRTLGNAQNATRDPAAALDTLAEALALAEKWHQPLEVAQTLRDLGTVHATQRQTNAALQDWTRALDLYETENQYAQVARLYCDIGNVRRFLGQGQRALKDFEHALMVLNNTDDQETRGVVLSNAANAYVDQGDIESADAFFSESISIAQRLHDRAAEATRRGNHGWFLLSTGRIQRAIAALEHALRMSKENGLTLQAAVQTDNLGVAYAELHEYERALSFHEQALEMISRLNNLHWLSIFETNMGSTLLALNRTDDAEHLYQRALDRGHADDDVEVVIRAQLGLVRVALQRQQPDAAEPLLSEAVTLARRANMRRLLAEALTLRSQQEAAVGQYDRAEKSWNEAKRLFVILQAPQAKLLPTWLNGRQVEA